MSTFHVSDIRENQPDSTGATVVEVYAVVSSRFAIYRTAKRMMIQFSDDDIEGSNQRAALIPIEPLRSEVDGLIDAIRDNPSEYQQIRVRNYDSKQSKALRISLQGDVPAGAALLTAIRNDMVEDRASDIRTWHLIYSAAATLAIIVLTRVLAGAWFASAFVPFHKDIAEYWSAAAVGAIGAFFSIALQIRGRTVPVDLQPWDNISDALLRIFVGATSAAILIALLRSNMIALSIGGTDLLKTTHGLVLAAFVGGFTERLVAEFLSGVSVTSKAKPVETPSPVQPGGANERKVTGEAANGGEQARKDVTADAPADPASTGEDATEPDEEEVEVGLSAQEHEERQAVG